MKSISTSLVVSIVALAAHLAINSASAVIVAQDRFEDYSNGTLNGKAGGSGWVGGWSSILTGANVVDGGLSYSSGSIVINGGDKALSLTADGAPAISRQFDVSVFQTQNEFFFSYLFRSESTTGEANDFFNLYLSNDSDTANSGGIGDMQDNVNNASFEFGARVNGSTTGGLNVSSEKTYDNSGVTHLLVGRLSTDATQAGGGSGDPLHFDLLELWVNPSSTTAPPRDAFIIASLSVALGDLDFLAMRTVNISGDDNFRFDEFRIGTTFASVVPEPSSVALIAAGLAAIGFRRRRKHTLKR